MPCKNRKLSLKEKERRRLIRILESNNQELPKYYDKSIVYWRQRIALGISAGEAAGKLGITKTWYLQLEVGYSNPYLLKQLKRKLKRA